VQLWLETSWVTCLSLRGVLDLGYTSESSGVALNMPIPGTNSQRLLFGMSQSLKFLKAPG
ncbi:hypothetical protein KXS24_24970, partial [Salmonella enterica subsp. enterica serovar Weltevreden]|nr:hypothetical protein [Salmonella enterica subsp. enterica serovar Weltevreden]